MRRPWTLDPSPEYSEANKEMDLRPQLRVLQSKQRDGTCAANVRGRSTRGGQREEEKREEWKKGREERSERGRRGEGGSEGRREVAADK